MGIAVQSWTNQWEEHIWILLSSLGHKKRMEAPVLTDQKASYVYYRVFTPVFMNYMQFDPLIV